MSLKLKYLKRSLIKRRLEWLTTCFLIWHVLSSGCKSKYISKVINLTNNKNEKNFILNVKVIVLVFKLNAIKNVFLSIVTNMPT